MRVRIGFVMISIAAAGGLALSAVQIRPGEVAVVRRFGRVLGEPWGPGLHFALPLGIDRLDRIRIDEIRRVEVGMPESAEDPDDAAGLLSAPPGSGEYLTGDGNFVRARLVAQYRVADPSAFLFASTDRDRLLERLVESITTRVIAQKQVDVLLQGGRAEVAAAVAAEFRDRAERGRLGIEVLGVSLTEVRPPLEVQSEFAEAQSAASRRDRRIQEAAGEAALRLERGRAAATTLVQAARARAARRSALARAEADSFGALAARLGPNRAEAVRRIHGEAVRELLSRVGRKVMGDADVVDLGLSAESSIAVPPPPGTK
ncbi:MAG: SPFH domain-containing protein [Isosphaeraceae bacterium]|nr:SPFH domain-containing protein [Isosphaeraceae bacterium]